MNQFNTLYIKLSFYEVRNVNCFIIKKIKEMYVKLKDKAARKVKVKLKARVNV